MVVNLLISSAFVSHDKHLLQNSSKRQFAHSSVFFRISHSSQSFKQVVGIYILGAVASKLFVTLIQKSLINPVFIFNS